MHNHQHNSANQKNGQRRLLLAISITACWFVIELAGGIYTNSLALMADAAHMLTDLAALGLSLFALKISTRPARKKVSAIFGPKFSLRWPMEFSSF
jgi:cobalt-zinc-cadmium efflux system protein